MKKVREALERAWRLRNDQCIEEARALAEKLSRSLGSPLEHLGKPLPEPADEMAELALLYASLGRANRQWEQAQRLIDWVEDSLRTRGKPLPFQLLFQKALHAHAQGEHAKALEGFLSARLATPKLSQQALALANALICLENLGLPLEKTRAEIKDLLQRLPPGAPHDGLRGQLAAFESRHSFRTGQIGEVMRGKAGEETVDQAAYYRLWVAELPFHRFHHPEPERRERFALSHPSFYQKPYRLRTLQGVLHPDDLSHYRATELSDRLYLWTWKWLTQPEKFPVERVLSLFSGLDFTSLSPLLTAEDGQLIRNALSWLTLFDPTGSLPVQRVVENILQPVVEDFPWYALEYRAIAHLKARRDRDRSAVETTWKRLVRDPLWNAPDLLLPPLLRDLGGASTELGSLAPLASQLGASFYSPRKKTSRALLVDLSDFRLLSASRKAPLASETLCHAFELLHQKQAAPCEEILRVCFGISRFDPLIHNAKIFNLLARMRQLAPNGLRFQVRAGRVYAVGSWEGVEFSRHATLPTLLQRQPEWQAFTQRGRRALAPSEGKDPVTRPELALKNLKGGTSLTREELQTVTGKSKSTMNRLIARWLEEGILQKAGNARNTHYLIPERTCV